jgi:DNA-binding protein H-NS
MSVSKETKVPVSKETKVPASKETKLEIIKSNVEEAREYFKIFEYRHLLELRNVLAHEIQKRENEAVSQAKAEIEKIAADVGMSVHAILNLRTPKPPSPQAIKSPGAGIYRHPENPMLEWKGRGPHPVWIKEILARGITFESLRIAA